MAEKFGIDGTFGYGAAVHGYIFVMLSGRIGMYDLREELLAHTALAGYKYRQVGRGNAQSHFESAVKQFRIAYYAESLFYRC